MYLIREEYKKEEEEEELLPQVKENRVCDGRRNKLPKSPRLGVARCYNVSAMKRVYITALYLDRIKISARPTEVSMIRGNRTGISSHPGAARHTKLHTKSRLTR